MERNSHAKVVIKEESGIMILEVEMPKKLREEMEQLASFTSGTIPAL